MLKDIPYSTLKKDQRAYDILMLREQHQNTFANIAKEYGISTERVITLYFQIQIKKIRLYVSHIAFVLGHEGISTIRKEVDTVFDCYREYPYICAYLEKKYERILTEYRGGEPGCPEAFIKSLPPLKPEPDREMIARIVEMREIEKASFIAIGKEMDMTPEKARHTYEMFYHLQVLDHVNRLQKEAKTADEARAIWDRYFRPHRSAKKMYERMMADQKQTNDM